ncbi:MAG: hypothetical protein ACYTG2_14180 [Planctomycetota bacterium]|jgi:hypothetical protein
MWSRLTLVPTLFVLLAAVAPGAAPPAALQDDELTAAYRAAAAGGDHDALVELWRANANRVLVTIDADLEQSLSLRESSEAPDEAAIAALHERALFGARAATAATGHPIFLDYATAFTSWDAEQQKQFRAGQGAYRRASGAGKAGDHESAAQAARQCLELAEPLGDWWGTAMGHTALGRAQLGQGDAQGALVSFSRARMIHHDLGLQGSEYGNTLALIDVCEALGANPRGREMLLAAISLGQALGDDDGVVELQQRLTALDEAEPAAR